MSTSNVVQPRVREIKYGANQEWKTDYKKQNVSQTIYVAFQNSDHSFDLSSAMKHTVPVHVYKCLNIVKF